MKPETPPPDAGYQIRCPRLGHQIHFGYCRMENRGDPCFKILDCWHGHFDVAAYFRAQMPSERFEGLIHRQPAAKMTSLVELIEQAQKARESSDGKKDEKRRRPCT